MHRGQASDSPRIYGDADGYDAYMGRWSALLAPLFLRFAVREPPGSLLDIGCGTGSLLAAARQSYPGVKLVGVDPSGALLAYARRLRDLSGIPLVRSVAEALPFTGRVFDSVLSLLVLQEFPDPQRALADMRRVVRPGGIVAASQWDFTRMPVIFTLVNALAEVTPAALPLHRPPPLADESDLADAWRRAGFSDVSVIRIPVRRSFGDFNELWRPLLTGPTPSTMMLAGLPPPERAAVREIMQSRLGSAEPFELTAEAMAVRGVA